MNQTERNLRRVILPMHSTREVGDYIRNLRAAATAGNIEAAEILADEITWMVESIGVHYVEEAKRIGALLAQTNRNGD